MAATPASGDPRHPPRPVTEQPPASGGAGLSLAATVLGPDRETAPPDGPGSAVVVLHGLFGNARNWGAVVRPLARTRPVHSLDLRNHGASPWDDRMDIPALAEDLLAYIEGQGLADPVVIGHSLGGKAAMWLALTHPHRLKALVVVDIAPAPSPGQADLARLVDVMAGLPVSDLSRRAEAEARLAQAGVEGGLCRFLSQNLTRGEGEEPGFRWRLNLPVLRRALPDLAGFPEPPPGAVFRGPTLVLRGGESAYVPDAHRPLVRGLFPAARIVTLKGAGHWLHAEQPETTVRTLEAFLDRLTDEEAPPSP